MPTDFLALPRELRQDILYRSFEHAIEQDIGFNTNLVMLQDLVNDVPGMFGVDKAHFWKVWYSFSKNKVDDDDGSLIWEIFNVTWAPYTYNWMKTLLSIGEVMATNDLPYVLEQCLKELEGLEINLAGSEVFDEDDEGDHWYEFLLWPERWVGGQNRDEQFHFRNGQWTRVTPSLEDLEIRDEADS